MNITFDIVDRTREISSVRIIISHKGKHYRKSTGISVKTARWKDGKSGNQDTDYALRCIKVGLNSTLDSFSSEGDILRALERVSQGRWNDVPTEEINTARGANFIESFRKWSERPNPAQRQRRCTCKLIEELMGTGDNWNDITSAWYLRLVGKMNDKGYSKNYQGTVIAKVKTVMEQGYKMKLHTNLDYKDFKKPVNEVDSVYLTEAELDRIWGLELKDELESKCRDLLILGCYSGARWEDFSVLNKDNIKEGQLHYIQKKTGARVTIPCSARIKAVLKRNGGYAPKVGDVVFNRTIKVVCMRAKVNEQVQVRLSKGEGYEHKTVPKWKMVSSHTCRRTCCSLLASKNVPLNQIMLVSGHKSLSSLQKYLRQTMGDLNSTLAKLDFFK